MAMDDSGRMRVGVVMVGEGGGGGEVGLVIKSYNLQHTLGNKDNTRLLKTTTLMQWNPLMYASCNYDNVARVVEVCVMHVIRL